MALTGLNIFKLLPKTNCGECGVPTCLAFAMKLAQKKAELSECPYASEEAKQVLGAASEPPMRLLKIGAGADAFELGGETELYRHDKTFYHQTAIAIRLDDREEPQRLAAQISEADGYVIERVGERLHLDAFCLAHESRDRERFLAALKVLVANSFKAVILECADKETIQAGLALLDGKRPLLYPAGADAAAFADLAREANASLVVSAESVENLAAQAEKISQTGFKDLVLNLRSPGLGQRLQNNTIMRRSALRKGLKALGLPLVSFFESADEPELLARAVVGVCKYAGLVVLPKFSKELMLALFTLRQNIYSDPRRPIQVEPKLYAIGDPRPDSMVFVTTNFSLTYFIVSGEIENAGVSAWLVVPDCEGMSVLTAWAAGKFSGPKVAKFVKDIKLEEHVVTRNLVIPGYAAAISGELEEALPNWKVVVGPQDAADLGSFIANYAHGQNTPT
jgi:acetyl-CoA decarbonylase/synthase, CODH/ACS complex subunit gamma